MLQLYFLIKKLVRNDMDVNEQCCYCCSTFSTFHSHNSVFNNENTGNSYPKVSVKGPLTCNCAVFFIFVNKEFDLVIFCLITHGHVYTDMKENWF